MPLKSTPTVFGDLMLPNLTYIQTKSVLYLELFSSGLTVPSKDYGGPGSKEDRITGPKEPYIKK